MLLVKLCQVFECSRNGFFNYCIHQVEHEKRHSQAAHTPVEHVHVFIEHVHISVAPLHTSVSEPMWLLERCNHWIFYSERVNKSLPKYDWYNNWFALSFCECLVTLKLATCDTLPRLVYLFYVCANFCFARPLKKKEEFWWNQNDSTNLAHFYLFVNQTLR